MRIPTITDPRGTDFAAAHKLKQQPWMLDLERRAIAAFEALGVLMTDTCINYQTIMPPVRGEHVAYGDTGVVIYSNSVCGARSNFEGGPSALSAGLTGRTPRYGYHLDEHRQATLLVEVELRRRANSTTGARSAASSDGSPATTGRCRRWSGIDRVPGSDEMKHFGAALASYGSVALFHMVGITPEAQRLDDVVPGGELRTHDVGEADVRAFQASYAKAIDSVDLVVFSAPQLSLSRCSSVAELLDGTARHHPAARRHQPAGQAGRRPHGPHRADRERRAARCSPACASTRATPARWRRRTAGSGSPPIRPSSPTSSAATATSRR